MAFYDIITPDDLKRDAINSLNIDVTDETVIDGIGKTYKQVSESIISDVSGMIDTYLNRKVIVDEYDLDTDKVEWQYNDDLGKYFYYGVFPVVQVESSGATISRDNLRILSGEIERKLNYFAGWKRPEQDLSALQDEHSDLDTLPEDIPFDIRRACQRICMYELGQALNNTYAERQRTQNTGQATTEITQVDPDFVWKELKRIHKYKILVV